MALLRGTLTDTADDDPSARLRGYAAVRELLDGDCAGDEALADDLRRLALLESEKRADNQAMDSGLRTALFFPSRRGHSVSSGICPAWLI